MITVIDNYDSFTFNIVQYLREANREVRTVRNDKVTIDQLQAMNMTHLVVSPGPCTPNEAGISVEAIRFFAGKVPILGVCLGHQSIGVAFGGKVGKASKLMHGKASTIHHSETGIFQGMPNPFRAIRYHSLVIEGNSLPDCLEAVAYSEDGEIMAVQHRKYAITGLQFHPESILTENGKNLIRNFLQMSEMVTI